MLSIGATGVRPDCLWMARVGEHRACVGTWGLEVMGSLKVWVDSYM